VTTYGYKTKRALPAAEGKPKVCTRCDLWFLAGPRERTCFGCLPASQRTLRAVRTAPPGAGTGVRRSRGKAAGHDYLKSAPLGVTFKPGTPLSKVLAVEAAAWLDADPKARPTRPPWDAC
jgi:hypothetical protein